jgi:hypothetical protein
VVPLAFRAVEVAAGKEGKSMNNIFQRINAVRKQIKYVQKDKDVSTGKGSYRAVTHDMVTAMVRPHMVEQGIVCFPVLVSSAVSIPPSKDPNEPAKQIRYEATYDFHFVNEADAGDKIVLRIEAHAMDNADKAPGKAISYAKKYAVLKLFEIETGEDEESRSEPGGMGEQQVTDFVTTINDATSMEVLQTAYIAAYKVAQAEEDKDAMAVFTRAKDNRKKALSK